MRIPVKHRCLSCWTHGDSTCSVPALWFNGSLIHQIGQLGHEACPGELTSSPSLCLPTLFLNADTIYPMLTFLSTYTSFLWTLAWKWSIFLMVVAHLQLWAPLHHFSHSMSVVWLSIGFLPSGFLLGCSSTDRGLGVRGWFIAVAPSLPVTVAVLFPLPWAAGPVWSPLPVFSREFLACADSPSGTSSLAFQGTR